MSLPQYDCRHELDILFINETWQLADVSPAVKVVTPLTHQFHHPASGSGIFGGGVGVFIGRHIPNVKFPCRKLSNFERVELQFILWSYKIVACFVYRPAGHIVNDFILCGFWEYTNSYKCAMAKNFFYVLLQCLDAATKKMTQINFFATAHLWFYQ